MPYAPGYADRLAETLGLDENGRLLDVGCGPGDRTADDVVARGFSRSDMAPHLFGDRLKDFERGPRALLVEISPDGIFAEQLPDTEIWYGRK